MDTGRTGLRIRQIVLIAIILLELWGLIAALAGPAEPAATPVGLARPSCLYAKVDLGGSAAHAAPQAPYISLIPGAI